MGGGTFIYPDAGMEVDLKGLTSDVSGGNWHITGLVKKYAGVGLYLTCKTDMSNYAGLSFDIQGTFTGNGMGDGGVPAASVTMTVGDAQTDVDSAHNSTPPTWGTCVAGDRQPVRRHLRLGEQGDPADRRAGDPDDPLDGPDRRQEGRRAATSALTRPRSPRSPGRSPGRATAPPSTPSTSPSTTSSS